jgi:parallel beta-helix repeat protein
LWNSLIHVTRVTGNLEFNRLGGFSMIIQSSLSSKIMPACLIILVCLNGGNARVLKVPGRFPTIQKALNAASPGDTVFVKKGVYREMLSLKTGVSLIGENPLSTRIVGNGKGNVITGADRALVSGLTIERSGPQFFGVVCNSTSPVVAGNIIIMNGGGIRLVRSNALVENNLIVKNDNGSDYGTTGIFCQFGKPVIRNNIISNNNARFAVMCDSSSPDIVRNIISFNLGGIGCFGASNPGLHRNDVWENSFAGNYMDCTPDGESISQDPKFMDISKGDYRLKPDSPCLKGNDKIGMSGYRLGR